MATGSVIPRLVLAAAAVEAPVPPSAIAKSVMPVITPPVIFGALMVNVSVILMTEAFYIMVLLIQERKHFI